MIKTGDHQNITNSYGVIGYLFFSEGDTLRVRSFHCSLTHALTVSAWHICNGYVTTVQPLTIPAWHLCNG